MTIKLTNRGKVVLVSLLTSPALAIAIGLGIATPALAPAPAHAITLGKYFGAKILTDRDLVQLLKATGFKGIHLKEAWAIAKKESQGHPLDYNGNWHTGDKSYGLFQINMLGSMGNARRGYYGLASNAELLNPVTNAKIAYLMSDAGKDWSDWKGVNQPVVKYYMEKYPYKTPIHKINKKQKQ